MDDEKREDFAFIAGQGQLVSTMTNTKGWTEVVRPALDERRNALVGEILIAEDFNKFVGIQQGINAIDNLINFIETILVEGKVALEELREQP